MKIGLIGAGAIANAHLSAYSLNPHVEEIFVADPNQGACENAMRNFSKVKGAFSDYKELLEKDIALVDICVPHYLHYPLTIDALKAGKDVICEKPIAMTLEEADEMLGTAERMKRRLFIDMNQRFMPYHKKAKEMLGRGEIGKPFLAIFNITGNAFREMNDPHHWKGSWDKAGGGALFDTGYHAIYMMLHFFGKPRSVMASTRRLLVEWENKADDNSAVILNYDDLLGTIVVSYTIFSEAWQEKRFIYGTEGSIHIQDEPLQPLILIKENQPQVIPTSQPPDVHPHPYSIKLALDHFIDCVVYNREPEVKAEEARDALALALAIYRSSIEGRRMDL